MSRLATHTHTREGGGNGSWKVHVLRMALSTCLGSFGSWHYADRYSDGNFRFKSSSNHCSAKSTLLNCFILVVESVQADDLREEKNVS